MHVNDLFLISFLDGDSPVTSLNAITSAKSYKIALRVRFSGVHYLLLIKSVLIKLINL